MVQSGEKKIQLSVGYNKIESNTAACLNTQKKEEKLQKKNASKQIKYGLISNKQTNKQSSTQPRSIKISKRFPPHQLC